MNLIRPRPAAYSGDSTSRCEPMVRGVRRAGVTRFGVPKPVRLIGSARIGPPPPRSAAFCNVVATTAVVVGDGFPQPDLR
jgi:hypothetical protein